MPNLLHVPTIAVVISCRNDAELLGRCLERFKAQARLADALITVDNASTDSSAATVSTRRMNDLVATLGIANLSKSRVSRMSEELDEMVADFKNRPLDPGVYAYLSCDALTIKVREGGRVVARRLDPAKTLHVTIRTRTPQTPHAPHRRRPW